VNPRVLTVLALSGAFLRSFALLTRGAQRWHFEIVLAIGVILLLSSATDQWLFKKFDFKIPTLSTNLQSVMGLILKFFVPLTVLVATVSGVFWFAHSDAPPERVLNIYVAILLCASPQCLRWAVPTALASGAEAMRHRDVGGQNPIFEEMITNQVHGNIFFAGLYNIVAIIFAVEGYLSPIEAALTSAFSQILLLLFSLSLKYRIRKFIFS
jgi:hypothetical protein